MKAEEREKQFASVLAQTMRLARTQGNVLTNAQIAEAFSALALDDQQLSAVEAYFREHRILIGAELPADGSASGTGERDGAGARTYQAALDDEELEAVFADCLNGDTAAKAKLIEAYLPMVEDVSRLYLEQGVLQEDLIGEGNVALVAGAELIGAYETVRDAEEGLFQCVMGAMEALVRRTMQEKADDEKTLSRVRDVAEHARRLSQEYRRDITITELIDETDLTGEDIEEVLRLVGYELEGLNTTAGEGL